MRIVIAGAGVVGRRLAARLASDRHDVVVVELNRELCDAVSAEYGVAAICGNATDIVALEEAEIGRADVAVALMGLSADNLAFSLLVHGAGVERIIARMPNPRYRAAYEMAGVTSILDATGLFLDRLILEIERPPVHQVATIADGQGMIVWITVVDGSVASGKALDELRADRRFPRGCMISGLVRAEGGRLLFPTGHDRLLPRDQALLIGTIDGVSRAADLLGQKQGLASMLFQRRHRGADEEEAHARLETAVETEVEEPEEEIRGVDVPEA